MPDFRTAVEELVRRATTSGTLQDLQRATAQVQKQIYSAPAEERNDALRRLDGVLDRLHPVPAAKVAITCGALVESGGDPHISGPGLLALLPGFLQGAVRFHDLCAERATAEGALREGEEEDGPPAEELAQKYFEAVHAEDADAAFAFLGVEEVTLAVIAHLARSKQLRAAARTRPDALLERSLAHDRVHRGGHSFLTKMLLVLDDEPLLVLDTDQHLGYRARFSAIPDNFALHTCLMGHLFGDPAEGWIEAVNFDMAAIRHALTHVCGPDAPILTGAFNLWNWTGVQPDGTLPEPQSASAHWVWNEGVPADILPFEGERVVVLGQPPYARSWRGGLIFSGLVPEFRVEQKLKPDEVKALLRKLGSAPRPDSPEGEG